MNVVAPGERVSFTEPGAATLDGHLRLTLGTFGGGGASTSMTYWRQRPAPLDRFQLNAFPTIDEAWTLYLFARFEQLVVLEPQLEAMCHYVEDVRQGRTPDAVAPELTVYAVYMAIGHETLLGQKNPLRFLDEAFALFDETVAHLLAGHSVTQTAFIDRLPRFQKYVAALRDDQRLFDEDRRRGQAHRVTVPAQASLTGGERQVSLLVLDRPAATQFKLWARRADFALLLTQQSDGIVVLSADPSSKLKVGWLAPLLSERDGRGWYDGRDHDGTLIGSSREGSTLGLQGVVAELRKHLRFEAKRAPPGRWKPLAAVAALAVAVFGGVVATRRAPPSMEEGGGGAKGDPIPRAEVLNLLKQPNGPQSFARYALVAGVCGYQGERALQSPCRDARAVKSLLVDSLGYRPENVLYLVDKPEPGEHTDGVPNAEGLKLAVERFRARFPDAGQQSSFLFYYSGHGGYEKGARKDFGVLQPAGYFERPDTPVGVKGWDMQELIDDLRKGVPSQHVMLLLDACYSGWAVGAKGDEQLSDELKSLWNERAEVVITAGTRGQRAWEDEAEQAAWRWDGHSVLTAFLLAGLGHERRADSSRDGVVTDEELAKYLRSAVPPAVREARSAEQMPQFFRFDEHLPKTGQFFFLPVGAVR